MDNFSEDKAFIKSRGGKLTGSISGNPDDIIQSLLEKTDNRDKHHFGWREYR